MSWYKHEIKTEKDFDGLTKAFNEKYGAYDYTKDSRALDKTFSEILIKSAGDLEGKKVLVCGANSGFEIGVLLEEFKNVTFTACDISDEALKKLKIIYPKVRCRHATMEDLPFFDKEFDVYLNCRAIHSMHVDMEKVIDEASRVTKERIVISVSNGYLIEGEIVNGMYDTTKQTIETNKPKEVVRDLVKYLERTSYFIRQEESQAEIFIVATKKHIT